MPQHLRRAKQAKARLKNCLSIHSLSDNVLQNIFLQASLDAAITFSNFTLSKHLLYHTLNALYREVNLVTRHQTSQFYSSLLARPRLASQVKTVPVSRLKESSCDCCLEQTVDWRLVMNKAERKELEERMNCSEREALRECARVLRPFLDTDTIGDVVIAYACRAPALDPQILRLLFALLTDIDSICIYGKVYIHILLDEGLLFKGMYKSLRTLGVDYRRKPLEDIDRSLCRRLNRHLPNLDCLELHNMEGGMPCGSKKEGRNFCVPAKSWNLSTIRIVDILTLEESCHDLFLSFAPTLRRFDLSAIIVHRNLPDWFQHLPPTLESLAIHIGQMTCGTDSAPILFVPILDRALERFTQLKFLQLSGSIVTSAFFLTLPRFEFLETLAFGYHIPLDGPVLVELIKDPTSLPLLKTLEVLLCHCPLPGVELCQPRWSETFRWVHASKCIRAASQRGIEVGGNLKCAVAMCDRKDGHQCFRVIGSGARNEKKDDKALLYPK